MSRFWWDYGLEIDYDLRLDQWKALLHSAAVQNFIVNTNNHEETCRTCSRTEAGATLPEALLPYHFPL